MSDATMTPEQQQAYDTALERIEACRVSQSTRLDLEELGLTRLPPQLFELTNLTALYSSDNKLIDLPPQIGQLKALTHLFLNSNHISDLPPQIGQLKALTYLLIDSNQLCDLPPEIGQLTALKVMYLSRNLLHSLPPQIAQFTALTKLNLSQNELSSLPPQIGQLTALTELDLWGNQLSNLPLEIGQLTALTKLDLSRNQLSSVPPQITQFTALSVLDLTGNQLNNLSPQISQLTALTELFLHHNPALTIPDSVLGPRFSDVYGDEKKTAARPQDILNWYFSQREGAAQGTLRAVNEVKVMLVGRGEAGKTSLRRFFMGQEHAPNEPETPGIALDSFALPCAKGNMTVRLWDFAGQEITHALHQFFLTEGCIYVLVLDPRSNTETQDAEYWLGLLQRYAGGAPVLLALNRQDARPGGYDVDRRMLQERFPSIQSFTPTNCEKREGCDELIQQLRLAIETLKDTEPPHLQVPQGWLQVMADCENQAPGRQQLTLDQFRSLCVKRGESTPAMQESLARLLHKLGTVLHFVDEPRLRDTAVLNPHWVTDGVYRLLRCNERPGSDGMLSLADAKQALPGENEETARFFLRLMERFEMCFPLDEEENGNPPSRWLIPGALGEFQPEKVTTAWQQPGSVRMRYVYDPLPAGVLPRFIVRTHLLSEEQPRWRHGVVLQDGQARALVRRGRNRNHVEITAFGPEAERLRLLEIIQGNFERIHADLPNPKPVAELALSGLPDIFRPVTDLEAAERGKQQVALTTPAGATLVEPTPQLNQTSEPAARDEDRVPLHAFLSYSHQDKKAKGVFELNLTVMAKKKLTSHWHDGLIEPGMRWREEVEENLAKMNIFVGLLTTAFLASDFIEQVEIKAARAKLRAQDKDFLFVLILVDDISLDGLDLAEYQILKPGGKAVCQHKSRKDGFNQAQKQLEQLILKLQETEKERRRAKPDFQRMPLKAQEGITFLIQGDYIHGNKPMTLDQSIHIGGNVTNSQVGQTMTNCHNMVQQQAPGERKDLLETLHKQVQQLIAELPEGKKDEASAVAENLELLVKQVTSAKPNRKWYSVSSDGLLEAASWVKNFSTEIGGTLTRLGSNTFGADFSLPETVS